MGILPSHPSSSYSAVPQFPPRAGSSERVWGEWTAHRRLRPVRFQKRRGGEWDLKRGEGSAAVSHSEPRPPAVAPARWQRGASHGERPRIPRAASFSAPPRAATELKTAARR